MDENINAIEALFTDSHDFVKRRFPVGRGKPVWLYVAYIDMMNDRQAVELTVIAPLMRFGAVREILPGY
jgi:hypothetical protein